jgi:hypothetical protein
MTSRTETAPTAEQIAADILPTVAGARLLSPSALLARCLGATEPEFNPTYSERPCTKCNGGFIALYSHIDGGRCFACQGTEVIRAEDETTRQARKRFDESVQERTRICCAALRIIAERLTGPRAESHKIRILNYLETV